MEISRHSETLKCDRSNSLAACIGQPPGVAATTLLFLFN